MASQFDFAISEGNHMPPLRPACHSEGICVGYT